jgi:uncharacterized membrane protein YkvI
MIDILYTLSSLTIAIITLSIALLILYFSYRFGRRKAALSEHPSKSQITAVQSALLGLISLLIGFSFTIAHHHYDERSKSVVGEANAIGTTYLRAQSLPNSVRSETLTTIAKYVDIRVESNKLSSVEDRQKPLLKEASQLRSKLWTLAMKSVKEDDRVATSGIYIQTLNDLIDSYGTRDEILNRHIPQSAIFLFLLTFFVAVSILGYTSGIARHRPTMAVLGYIFIIVFLFSMTMDLDRPRRGFIQVSQKNMIDLQEEIRVSR